MRFTAFHRFRTRFGTSCAAILARRPRLVSGLGMVTFIFAVMAGVVLVMSAMITPRMTHQQVAPPRPDASIEHRMMQDQRAISRATRTYTLSTFAATFGHKGD